MLVCKAGKPESVEEFDSWRSKCLLLTSHLEPHQCLVNMTLAWPDPVQSFDAVYSLAYMQFSATEF